MFLLFTTFFLFLGVAKNSAEFSHASVFRTADQNLINFMLRSNTLSQENPTRSVTCFDYYIPLLNGITAEYERSYGACLSLADERRQEVDNSTKPEREAIENDAEGACSALRACNSNAGSIPYFECYTNAGSENTKVMYAIQQNSSSILITIREEYRLIENDQNRCTTTAERVYVESTSSTYEELQSCLQGKTPIPTTTQAPSTSTTVSTTTAGPENTPESSSEQPETTTAVAYSK